MLRRLRAGIFLFSLFSFTLAGIVNRTIDDSFGDSQTSQKPLYLPRAGVWDDQTCKTCAINPDPSKAFMKTYTAATYSPDINNISISMGFEGTAIYVFFILANNQGAGIITATMANFTIDGQLVGYFTYSPGNTSNILFNQLAFKKIDLPNGIHQLVISTSGIKSEAFINFDYAIYTYDDGVDAASPSSSSSGPSSKSLSVYPIVGGVVGAVLLIGAIMGCLFFYNGRTREQQMNFSWKIEDPSNQNMGSVSGNTVAVTTPFIYSFPDGNDYSTKKKANNDPNLSGSNQLVILSYKPSPHHVHRARQAKIQRRLHVVNQEMNMLKAELRAQKTPGARTGKFEMARTGGNGDIMDGIKEQMQAMQAQIELLQSQQQSPWAQGLTNDHPPGYTP
ncbi:hypothetical protein BDQ17DRAFT_1428557 [Cyathus striatus]|nr:hypothetical protein BDQ17DRAFT_1428557 [Cyathus striatus]